MNFFLKIMNFRIIQWFLSSKREFFNPKIKEGENFGNEPQPSATNFLTQMMWDPYILTTRLIGFYLHEGLSNGLISLLGGPT